MATENEYVNNLFQEIEMPNENETFNENNNKKLPVALFQEIESELHYVLSQNDGSESDDKTDGPIDFIRNIVETVKRDFDGVVAEGERKTFLHILTKIFATLLSVKTENIEEVIRLIKLSISTVTKNGQDKNSSKKSEYKALAAKTTIY